MLRYAAYRFLALVPLILIVALAAFSLSFLTPGDAAATVAGEGATVEQVAEVRHELGLDRPVVNQFGDWVSNLVRGDLGRSVVNDVDVSTLVGARLGATLSLVLAGMFVAMVIGIPAGLLAGMRPRSLVDRVLTTLTTLGIAVPAFWLGTILIVTFALKRQLLPAGGYVPFLDDPVGWLRCMVLPAIAIGAASAAELARQTRSAVTEVAGLDHVRTSRSMGVRDRRVLGIHVLRNSAIEIVTVLGLQVSRLIAAAVIVEQMFAIPGLGQLTVVAVRTRDLPTVQGVVIVTAFIVLFANVLVDLSYALINPRLRHR